MLSTKSMLGLVACAAMGLASAAAAQTIVAQWNFNNSTASNTSPPTSAGAGVAVLIGGTVPASSVTPAGYASGTGSSDTASPNTSWSIAGFPVQGTASGTAGFEFQVDCTGRSNLTFEFDYRASNGASKYWDVLYSTDGGATFTSFFPVGATTVLTTPGNTNFFNNFGNLFPAGLVLNLPAAANNNSGVRVRIVAVFDPAIPGTYTTNSTTGTYTPGNLTTSSTLRLDMVEIRDNTPVSLPPTISANAASPAAICMGGSQTVNFIVNTTPGQNPASATLSVSGNFSSIGGSATQAMTDIGGGQFAYAAAIPGTVTEGIKTISFTVTDDLSRSATTSTTVGVGNCAFNASSDIVISQVYGGGGSAASAINQDYVVLHNRGCSPVNIAGWSLQYGAAGSVAMSGKIDIAATPDLFIPVGGYYLIQTATSTLNPTGGNLGAGGLASADLAAITIAMGGTSGRVAIVQNNVIVTDPTTDPDVRDFVGYASANFEGAGAAPAPSTTNALFRKLDGNQDTNQNFNDFDFFVPAPVNSASPAVPNTCLPACPADLADINGNPNPDGGVDVNDLIYFLVRFEAGNMDLDNDGVDPQVLDNATDISDLLFFLVHFEAGC
jgi:Lamin Tail Domain